MKNLRNIGSGFVLGAISVATGLGLNQPAMAQTSDRAGGIEEIIVTGTKREVSAQDVPIAVTAISDDMLRNQQRNDILVLGEMSPGVALGQVAGFRAIGPSSDLQAYSAWPPKRPPSNAKRAMWCSS